MKKFTCKILATVLILGTGLTGCSKSGSTVYTGTGEGFGGTITAKLTMSGSEITDVVLEGPNETESIGGVALEELAKQVLAAQSYEIDGVTGATVTTEGVKEAVKAALAGGNASTGNVEVTFTPGTYEGNGEGYLGNVKLAVTFTENGISNIEVKESKETGNKNALTICVLAEVCAFLSSLLGIIAMI